MEGAPIKPEQAHTEIDAKVTNRFADVIPLGVFDKKGRLTADGSRGACERTSFDTFDVELDQHRGPACVDVLGSQKIVDGNGFDFIYLVAGTPVPVVIEREAGVTLPIQDHFLSGNGVDRAMIDRNRLRKGSRIAFEDCETGGGSLHRDGSVRSVQTRPDARAPITKIGAEVEKDEGHRARRTQECVDFGFILPIRIQKPVPIIIVGRKTEADAVLENQSIGCGADRLVDCRMRTRNAQVSDRRERKVSELHQASLKERLKIARLEFAVRSVEHNCGQVKPFQQASRQPVFFSEVSAQSIARQKGDE
jgi:hypothetical protein